MLIHPKESIEDETNSECSIYSSGPSLQFYSVLLIVVSVFLSSCGGGGSTGTNGSDLHTVNGTVFGPDAVEPASRIQSELVKNSKAEKSALQPAKRDSGEANADILNSDRRLANQKSHAAGSVNADTFEGETSIADARVNVYDLVEYISDAENVQPLASATTGPDGEYSVSDVPGDIDILVMVETNPRLSSVQFGVDDNTTADINSATTLATERWAPELLDGNSVSEEDFMETVGAAEELLSGRDGQELAYILDELIPQEFGNGFPGDLSPPLQTIANELNGVDLSACENLQLETNLAEPLRYIEVSGVAEELGDEPRVWIYDAEIMEPSEDDQRSIYMERTADQKAEIITPFHPTHWREGGNIKVVVLKEDTSLTCPALDLEVGPLEPAPGTRQEMVNELDNNMRSVAENLGFNPDDLLEADLREVDPFIMGTASLLQVIDGPNNPNNLRNLVSGDAPIYEGESISAETEALYDAIYAQMGIDDFINEISSELKGLTAPFNGENPFGSSVSKRTNFGQDVNIPVQDKFVSPRTLDLLMTMQSGIESLNTGASGEFREFVEIASGTVSGTVALVPGGQSIAAQIGLAGNVVSYTGIALSLAQNTLPSNLQDIEIDLSQEVFNEDEEGGQWDADIAALTEEWTLEWDQALGGIPGLGPALKVLNRVAPGSVTGSFMSLSAGIFEELWKIETDSGPLTIDEFVFNIEGGIDPNRSNEENYFAWQLETQQSETGADPIVFLSDESRFETRDVGISNLRVRTEPGSFQDQFRESIESIEVLPIEVTITGPDGALPYVADPGEEVPLLAMVENAEDRSVEWHADAGYFTNYMGEENRSVTYVVPDAEGNYEVRAKSIANTGARSDEEPVRRDIGTVVVGDLNVSPTPPCVMLGEPVEFNVDIAGQEIPFSDVDYTISGPGSLGTDGVFVPVAEGEVTIEFNYQSSESTTPRTTQVSFEVKEFCSYFSVNTDKFDYTSNCSMAQVGPSIGGSIGGPVDDENPTLTSGGGVLAYQSWINEEGEWTKQVSGLENQFMLRFDLNDYFPNGDPMLFIGPSRDSDTGAPIGNQVMTVEKDIAEVFGSEVVLYSGSINNVVFNGDADDPAFRAIGSVEFQGIPNLHPDYIPSGSFLAEWGCYQE